MILPPRPPFLYSIPSAVTVISVSSRFCKTKTQKRAIAATRVGRTRLVNRVKLVPVKYAYAFLAHTQRDTKSSRHTQLYRAGGARTHSHDSRHTTERSEMHPPPCALALRPPAHAHYCDVTGRD